MQPYYSENGIQIFHGDCRDALKSLADCSVDSVVTDPPYHLTANKKGGTGIASLNLDSPAGRARATTGFMGKAWDGGDVAHDPAVWAECLRVLKPGGHLLAFGGSRTYHRLACAIEDAGFEIRDQIQWIYGSGFPKSLDISKAIDAAAGETRSLVERVRPDGKKTGHAGTGFVSGITDAALMRNAVATTEFAQQWDGWGTALKPAHEPIVLARKPIVGTVAANVLEHGTGGLNIDRCRIESEPWYRPRIDNPAQCFSNAYAQDQWTRTNMARGKNEYGNSQGRWPANVIHDGSEEVLAGFPSVHGAGSARVGGAIRAGDGGLYHGLGNHDGFGTRIGDTGSAARFFYCAKASGDDREEGLEASPLRSAGAVTDRKDGSDGLNSPRAGAGRTNGSRNHHPTVKPTDLMRYLCRLVTPPGGIVLDPFCGSGSTGKAAILEGLNFIGIELSAEYCELAQKRIEAVTRQGSLFGAEAIA